MDAREYDRISDLLCQIRAKIENNLTTNKTHEIIKKLYIEKIWELLQLTDSFADLDQKGLL